MNKKFIHLLFTPAVLLIFSPAIFSQSKTKPSKLFDSDSVFQITISGNIRDILNDRTDEAPYRPLTISYTDDDNKQFEINAEAKTRGHFRKLTENCIYPPLLLHFTPSDTLSASVFYQQQKLKLVMPCRGDEYVIHEWLAYKVYNLITPKSFRARLTRVTINDDKGKKNTSFYGILLEEESQVAARNHCVIVDRDMRPEDTRESDFLTMTMFQYLIGNTDWSVQFLQNIKLIAKDSTAIPSTVPYDFDNAGIVNSPYALPAEELKMSSVRERRYRGYCMQDLQKFDSVITVFNNAKDAIYKLYTNYPLIDSKYKKSTIKYLDDFYITINNPVAFQKAFAYPCDKNGTGNVVIRGLRSE